MTIPLVLKYDQELEAIPNGNVKAAKFRSNSTEDEDYSIRLMMSNREELKRRISQRYRAHPLLKLLFASLLFFNIAFAVIGIYKYNADIQFLLKVTTDLNHAEDAFTRSVTKIHAVHSIFAMALVNGYY